MKDLRLVSRELLLFVSASLVLGIATSVYDSTFNNFLNESFALSGFQRSFLEFPRELPGFLVVFVSALFWFLCSRRLGALAVGLGALGALLLGYATSSYTVMLAWLFIYSLGQHLFIPISSTIGMELAHDGRTGQRLGQLNAIRNLAAILGSFLVFVGFRYLGFTFRHTFTMTAAGMGIAAGLLYAMKPKQTQASKVYFQLRKEYTLYYVLAVISGARKQLFVTFAPWVLVTVFQQPTQILATLYTLSGIIGILFQPFLGWAVDRLGERVVLATEAVALVFVCFGYGFAKFLLPPGIALVVVCGCFLADQMMFSVSMARATYMKKIALHPAHVQPALTAAVTIDHIFSISAAIVGGIIWNVLGFQYVFLLGMGIALLNLSAAWQVRLPQAQQRAPRTQPPEQCHT
jgi:MFS family permease